MLSLLLELDKSWKRTPVGPDDPSRTNDCGQVVWAIWTGPGEVGSNSHNQWVGEVAPVASGVSISEIV